jgi:predicted ATPase/DNA-binding winged helix-turn-helix (wHTH) protein
MAELHRLPLVSNALPAQEASPTQPLRLGRFDWHGDSHQLWADGAPAPLRARALAVLAVLAERPGRLVSRDELLERVWADRVVEENNLSVQISALRKVLGDVIVATVPGLGYRLVLAPASAPQPVDRAAPPPDILRTNLPDHMAPLIGREQDLQALGRLVDAHALVSVLGAGGMGKTRLAHALLQARREFYPQGVCMVELATLAPASGGLLDAVKAALGMDQAGIPTNLPNLVRQLAPLQMLIALDNVEHLVNEVAALAAAVLAGAPGIRLLITSQAPLRLAQEQRYRLDGLPLPPANADAATARACGAVALFTTRAAAMDHRVGFTDAQIGTVAMLCQRLDGSPLAIELAAARLRLMGLPALVAALAQPLQMLTQGHTDGSSRHQTVRAALAWSHALLGPDEQTVFRRLAVFVGSTPLPMALRVLADEPNHPGGLDRWTVLDALGGLVDRSLVSLLRLAGSDAEDEPRYRLLEAPLALAHEHLAAANEATPLQQRHALAVLARFEQTYARLLEGECTEAHALATLAPDIDNAQAALRWTLAHQPAAALALAPLLSMAMGRHRHAERVLLWQQVEPLLDVPPLPLTPPGTLARAQLFAADHWLNTRTRHACERAHQARALALARGEAATAHLALRCIAGTSARLGDIDALHAAADAAAAAAPAQTTPYLQAVAPAVLAWRHGLDGDPDRALQAWQQLARLNRQAGISDANAMNNCAGMHLAAGRCHQAVAAAQAQAAQCAGERDSWNRCCALSIWAGSLLMLDDAASARPVLAESWPLADMYDMLPLWADDGALIAALEGRPHAALRLMGYADAAFAALGQPREAVDQVRIARAERLAMQALVEAQGEAVASTLALQLKAQGATLPEAALPRLALATQE